MTCQGCDKPLPPSRGAPRKWCSDRCRKRTLYSGVCMDCGGRTDGVASGRSRGPVQRCSPCAQRHNHESRYWTPERIIAALRRAADENGGIPPSASAWLKGPKPEWAPFVSVVQREFGSWNNALTAAGIDPRPVGCYGREGEDPDLCMEIRERYEAGASGCALAREYGCTDMTIYRRVSKAGGTIRTLSESQALRRAA